MGRIVAGFPGIGKSYLFKNGYRFNSLLDSDSSKFSWINENGVKKRNPNFVSDYLSHIRAAVQSHDFVFVSTHKEVLEALHKAGLSFVVVFPSRKLKSAYLERYQSRGNDESFLKLMSDKFEDFVTDIEVTPYSKIRLLHSDLSLVDALDILPEEDDIDDGFELEVDF